MNQLNLLLNELEDHGMGKQATRKLQKKIEEFHQVPKNQNGRGVKPRVKKTSIATLKHLVRAQKSCELGTDPQIRTMARKLVTSSYHVDFNTLIDLARTFCGKANKHSESVRERRNRELRRKVIPVSRDHTLEKITTSKFLQSVGLKLHNCLAHPRGQGSYSHEQLRSGERDYWFLSKRDIPVCVIEIDSSNRTIEECEGIRGSTPELSRALALNICEELGVSGDGAEAFAKVGAFQMFQSVNEVPEALEIQVDNRVLQIWITESELVVKERASRSGTELWSKFEKEDHGSFLSTWVNEMEIDELLMLVIEFDELRDELKRVQVFDKPRRSRESSVRRRRRD